MNKNNTNMKAILASRQERDEKAAQGREAGLQSASTTQWKGYTWKEYQTSIVSQNHYISQLEAERDTLKRQNLRA